MFLRIFSVVTVNIFDGCFRFVYTVNLSFISSLTITGYIL